MEGCHTAYKIVEQDKRELAFLQQETRQNDI